MQPNNQSEVWNRFGDLRDTLESCFKKHQSIVILSTDTTPHPQCLLIAKDHIEYRKYISPTAGYHVIRYLIDANQIEINRRPTNLNFEESLLPKAKQMVSLLKNGSAKILVEKGPVK